MTLEPVPCEGPSTTTNPGAPTQHLRRLARRELTRRRRSPQGPTLSVLGVVDGRPTMLRHGFDRPAELVFGLEVPAAFDAVLTIASSVIATRHRLVDGQVALAVDRRGEEVVLVATGQALVETRRPRGWLVDACRRSLGLTTRPEGSHPLVLPLALWLDRLMVEIVQGRRSITWEGARARCPVPAQCSSPDPAQLGATLASVTPGWHRLRSAAAAGARLPIPIEPSHAAWMDEPMFARWCLGFFPDLDDLRADVEFIAPPEVAAGVAETIAAAFAAAQP